MPLIKYNKLPIEICSLDLLKIIELKNKHRTKMEK